MDHRETAPKSDFVSCSLYSVEYHLFCTSSTTFKLYFHFIKKKYLKKCYLLKWLNLLLLLGDYAVFVYLQLFCTKSCTGHVWIKGFTDKLYKLVLSSVIYLRVYR